MTGQLKKKKTNLQPHARESEELVQRYVSGEDARLKVQKEILNLKKESMQLKKETFQMKKEELQLKRRNSSAIVHAADKIAILASEMTTYYRKQNEKFDKDL